MRDFLALEREDVEELVHVAPVQSTPSGRGQAKGLSERSARMMGQSPEPKISGTVCVKLFPERSTRVRVVSSTSDSSKEVKELFASSITESDVNCESDFGTSPVSWLLERPSSVRETIPPKISGRSPDNSFPDKSRVFSLRSLRSDFGMLPLSLLAPRIRVSRVGMSPRELGMGPEIWLLEEVKVLREVALGRQAGSEPLKLLKSK